MLMQIASDTLGWDKVETRFPLEGKLQFTQPADANWKKPGGSGGGGGGGGSGGGSAGGGGPLSPVVAVLAVQTADQLPEVALGKDRDLIFPQDTSSIKDASLILMRDKNSKPTLVRVSLKKSFVVAFDRRGKEEVGS